MKMLKAEAAKAGFDSKILLGIFILALGLRLTSGLFLKQMPIEHDALQYNAIAKNILDGKGFTYDSIHPTAARAPMYPYFLAAIYRILGYNYIYAKIAQAIIGAITCLFVYQIAKNLYSSFIGILAAMVTCIYPSLIGYSNLLYSETLTGFLLVLSVFVFITALKKNKVYLFVMSGVSFGLLSLNYPKFMFLPLVLGFSFCSLHKFKASFLKSFFWLLLAVSLVIAPWTIRNLNTFGKLIPVSTGFGTTLWYSTLPGDYTEWDFDKEPLSSEFRKYYTVSNDANQQSEFVFSAKTNEKLAPEALRNIGRSPLLFVQLSIKRFFRQWLASNGNSFYALSAKTGDYFLNKEYSAFLIKFFLLLLHSCIIILGCIGIFAGLVFDKRSIFSPLLLTIIYSSFVNSIFITQPRYQIPVLGLLFVYVALGGCWLFLKLKKSKNIWAKLKS